MSGGEERPPGSWIRRLGPNRAWQRAPGCRQAAAPTQLRHPPSWPGELSGCPAAAWDPAGSRAAAQPEPSIHSPPLCHSTAVPPLHPLPQPGTGDTGKAAGHGGDGEPGTGVAVRSVAVLLPARAALRGPAV